MKKINARTLSALQRLENIIFQFPFSSGKMKVARGHSSKCYISGCRPPLKRAM